MPPQTTRSYHRQQPNSPALLTTTFNPISREGKFSCLPQLIAARSHAPTLSSARLTTRFPPLPLPQLTTPAIRAAVCPRPCGRPLTGQGAILALLAVAGRAQHLRGRNIIAAPGRRLRGQEPRGKSLPFFVRRRRAPRKRKNCLGRVHAPPPTRRPRLRVHALRSGYKP